MHIGAGALEGTLRETPAKRSPLSIAIDSIAWPAVRTAARPAVDHGLPAALALVEWRRGRRVRLRPCCGPCGVCQSGSSRGSALARLGIFCRNREEWGPRRVSAERDRVCTKRPPRRAGPFAAGPAVLRRSGRAVGGGGEAILIAIAAVPQDD